MRNSFFIFSFLLLTLFFSCNETATKSKTEKKAKETTAVIPEGWQTVKKEKYQVSYPADWVLDESGRMGTDFILFAPQSEKADNDFIANINLLTQKIPGKISLDDFAKLSKEQIANYVTDAKIIAETDTDLSGQEFKTMVYKGKQGINTLQFHQYYTLKDGKVFILTLTTKADDYDAYKDLGVQIMESIQFD